MSDQTQRQEDRWDVPGEPIRGPEPAPDRGALLLVGLVLGALAIAIVLMLVL